MVNYQQKGHFPPEPPQRGRGSGILSLPGGRNQVKAEQALAENFVKVS